MQSLLRRRLFVPLVYVAVILLLLLLALFAKSFSETLGGARISGRYSPLPLFTTRSLEELRFSWNGLDLRFSRRADPGLVRLETADGQADIVFAQDDRLHISPSEGSGGPITISPAGGGAKAIDMAIPFTVSGIIDPAAPANTLLWRLGGRRFQLSLPDGARIDYAGRIIDLSLSGSASQPGMRLVSLEPAAADLVTTGKAAAPAARLPDEKSLPTADQLTAAMGRFTDAAYAGWSTIRHTGNDGLWKMPDGSSGFTEDIGTALLAESLARGSFSASLQIWSDALENQASLNPGVPAGPATGVYTGRVRDFVKRIQGTDAAETERITGLAARSDPSLFKTPHVELFLLSRSGPGVAKDAIGSFLSKGLPGLDVPASLGLLEAIEDYAQIVGDDPSLPEKARQIVEKKVIPSITVADAGLFLVPGSDGVADVQQSIRCGSLLVRAGSLLGDTRTAAIGRGLVASSLALSTGAGFLPASIRIASGKVTAREGWLAPEGVYTLLPQDRYLPHIVPLFRQVGPGAWMWTSADVSTLESTDGTVRLGFTYPLKVPYHFVIRGLRPFAEIRLHGIPWHADPTYAQYSDGWSYDEATRTLFMKITGRVGQEKVEISF